MRTVRTHGRGWRRLGVRVALGVRLVGGLLGGGQAQAGATVVWQWDGGLDDLGFGYAVAGVGDVDGDGRADIVVGAPYASRPGHLGEAYLVRFTGEPPPAGVPDLSLSRDRLNFGTVRVGRNSTTGFILRNDGGAPLRITKLGPPRPPFYLDVLEPKPPFTLRPGQMEVVYVVFSPDAPGHYRQHLLVRSTDPDAPEVEVLLEGVARRTR